MYVFYFTTVYLRLYKKAERKEQYKEEAAYLLETDVIYGKFFHQYYF